MSLKFTKRSVFCYDFKNYVKYYSTTCLLTVDVTRCLVAYYQTLGIDCSVSYAKRDFYTYSNSKQIYRHGLKYIVKTHLPVLNLCTLDDRYDYGAIINGLNQTASERIHQRLKEVVYFNKVRLIIVCLDVKNSNLFKHDNRQHLLDMDSFALLAIDENGDYVGRRNLYSPVVKLKGLPAKCGINPEIAHLRRYLFRY